MRTVGRDATRARRHYISAMTAIRTVLFDLDGTLIDSVRLILDSYHHTLADARPSAADRRGLARGVGTPLTVQFADMAATRPACSTR